MSANMMVSAHMGLPYTNQCDPHTGVPYDAVSYAQPVYVCALPPAPRPHAARAYFPPPHYVMPAACPYDAAAWYAAAPPTMMVPALYHTSHPYQARPYMPPHAWAQPATAQAPPHADAWGAYRPPPPAPHVPAWPVATAQWPVQHPSQMGTAPGAVVPPVHAPMRAAPMQESLSRAHDVHAGAWPLDSALPEGGTEPATGAAGAQGGPDESARPPVPLEKTAVLLSHFGAKAVWRASAELVGLRRSTTRSGARLSPYRKTRSLSPESLPTDDCLSASSYSSQGGVTEPVTPPNTATPMADKALSEPPHASLSPSHEERSADLHRLVRTMGYMQQRPFPSLDPNCAQHGTAMVKSATTTTATAAAATTPGRRARISMKREHAALLGEVSPAFRHFAHQVLAQTLVSPTTLLLALHYVHMLQGTMWPDDGSGETMAGLSLLAQPVSTTPFKLFTLGLMMANKFLDDHTFLNKTWHEVTGIPLDELNRMESFFLCRTQFHLAVSDSAWRQHLQAVRADIYACDDNDKMGDSEDASAMVDTLEHILAAQVSGLCI